MIIFLNEVFELFWFLGCVNVVVKECGGETLISSTMFRSAMWGAVATVKTFESVRQT